MRYSFICFLLICALQNFMVLGVTEAQLKAAGKLLRKNCQPKTKATDESIENMHKGIWDDAKPTKCYAFCLLAFYKLVNKKGQIDEEAARAQLSMLPEPRQQPSKETGERCRDAGVDFTDKCDAAYALLKCVYFDNPENYFAP